MDIQACLAQIHDEYLVALSTIHEGNLDGLFEVMQRRTKLIQTLESVAEDVDASDIRALLQDTVTLSSMLRQAFDETENEFHEFQKTAVVSKAYARFML